MVAMTQFAGAFDSDETTFGLSDQIAISEIAPAVSDTGDQSVKEQSVLAGTSSRNISKGLDAIEAQEEAERQAAAAADAEAEAARLVQIAQAESRSEVPSNKPAETVANDGWQTGTASAYNVSSCGGSTLTASGAILTDDSMVVAVPASQSHLMGRSVEITWQGITVVATVADTGGFGAYGRALDLAPGVCKAFGIDTSGSAANCNRWGVQTVQYRFL